MKLTAVYEPLPWQVAPWLDKSMVLLLTGAAGGGKSRLAAEKINGFMKKYPGSTGLMLRKAREFCSKSIVPFFNKTVIGDDPDVIYKKSDYCFQYSNGSTLWWGGMKDDSQREAIRSIGQDGALDMVWIEEANAFTLADFEELLGRMRGKAADWRQVILSTNPDVPYHWIYQRLIKSDEATVYYSDWSQNPHNPEDYADTMNRLTGVRRQRLRDGKWVMAEGVVYDKFDTAIHVIAPFEIPTDWRRIRAIDFGYTNPFICQWWAIDPDERMYLYREIYYSQRTVNVHARQINDLTADEHIEQTICDHDAEDRATLEEHGIYSTAAIKDVSTGIQAVEERLKPVGDGKPRLFIMRGALVELDEKLLSDDSPKPTCTEEEILGYIWKEQKDGREAREHPLKLNDHGCDTMRYAVRYVDGAGKRQLEYIKHNPIY